MGETKKIVAERFPVERLPEELRGRLGKARQVRAAIEPQEVGGETLRQPLASLHGFGKGRHAGTQASSCIRSLRGE